MRLDLNLLAALDALLEEGSVAGAAARLHVTAPAMSRTLGRIRRATGDEILVRTGRTMTATPYALGVHARVHALVQQAEDLLAPRRDLDLAALERTFTLRWSDALTATCGPVLLAAVRTQAPGVRLRFLAEAGPDAPEPRPGEADLEAGGQEPLPENRHERVGQDRLVVALRRGHPLAGGPLTVDRYAAAHHVTVSRRGRLSDPVDEALAALGLRRRVVATVPTAAAALHLACSTDALAAVPALVSGPLLTALALRTQPLPLDVPPAPVHLSWHRRYEGDRAHAWLREQARAAIGTVCGAPGR
ncbi:LysR family transcriptional regulator [Streptomyces sp. NPDC090306]|uniref:LysR family transcriptional regulator n=1 Tax=unclassified Streptomyces TaxID=2593676 RepID=UPI0036E72FF8